MGDQPQIRSRLCCNEKTRNRTPNSPVAQSVTQNVRSSERGSNHKSHEGEASVPDICVNVFTACLPLGRDDPPMQLANFNIILPEGAALQASVHSQCPSVPCILYRNTTKPEVSILGPVTWHFAISAPSQPTAYLSDVSVIFGPTAGQRRCGAPAGI